MRSRLQIFGCRCREQGLLVRPRSEAGLGQASHLCGASVRLSAKGLLRGFSKRRGLTGSLCRSRRKCSRRSGGGSLPNRPAPPWGGKEPQGTWKCTGCLCAQKTFSANTEICIARAVATPPPRPLIRGFHIGGFNQQWIKNVWGGGWGLWSDLRDAGRPGRAASSAWSTCRLRFLLTVPCALGLTTTCTALHRIRCHQQSSEDSRQAGESRPCVGDAHPWVSVATWPQNLPRGCWGTTPSSRAGPRHLAFGLVSPAEM